MTVIPSEPLHVLLADDHTMFREGTRELLERDVGLIVVGEAVDGAQAVEMSVALRPDIVLLDMGMPVVNGIEATRRIMSADPDARVLILSAYDEEDYVLAALEAGAAGYLLKSARSSEVVAAIHAVASGQLTLHPAVARHLLRRRTDSAMGHELSVRELEVLRLAARGGRTRDIADDLSVSPRTIEACFTNIFNKLGVATRAEAIIYAATRGWITLQRSPKLDVEP